MVYDLQKASMWKRIAAWMFDGILVSVLAVGIGFLISMLLGYDAYSETLNMAYAEYETQYAVTFEMTEKEYAAMTEAELANYNAAYDALIADDEAMYAYHMMMNLSILITTMGILTALVLWEFVIPLLFGNGQTLGKKIFSLGVMRTDNVRLTTIQLFIRTILGKFTIETMIPVYILLMLFWGTLDLTGTLLLGALLFAQVIILIVTHTNSLIHDLLAGTVVVDISSQMIFEDTQALIEYQKKIHAERAARQDY